MNNCKYYYKNYYDTETFDADEVYPGIYVGDWNASLNKEKLEENNIKNILSIVNGCAKNYPADFNYELIHVNDDDWVNISAHFDRAVEFIKNSLDKKEKILVHCSRGMSRSVSLVIAYMMDVHKMSYEESLSIIKSKRSCANPNPGFETQLREHYQNS
jgi:protein-tyrosine phosphatase